MENGNNIKELEAKYLALRDSITDGMSYDEFIDWLNLADNVSDLEAGMHFFLDSGQKDKAEITRIEIERWKEK